MRKILSSLMVIVIVLNFILCNKTYATDFQGVNSITQESISSADQEALVHDGEVNFAGQIVSMAWKALGGIFAAIGGILVNVINYFPLLIQGVMSIICDNDPNVIKYEPFSIERAVFNEIKIFDIDYFDLDEETNSAISISLRKSVAKTFMIMRLLAVAISLVILIYVGIRMALSTISADKAKYKKMLVGWVEGIVLLFLIQYIIVILLGLGQMFNNIILDMKNELISTGGLSFEVDTMSRIGNELNGKSGWTFVLYSIVFWFLTFIQIKFFIFYLRRVITVGFLIVIAPLISIIYPIDKVGDGKSQSFSVWFNELAMNIFIQPIHAIIYLVFMFSAGEIAKYSMVVALILLLSLTKIEKIVLHLFNLKNVTSLKPVDSEKTKI